MFFIYFQYDSDTWTPLRPTNSTAIGFNLPTISVQNGIISFNASVTPSGVQLLGGAFSGQASVSVLAGAAALQVSASVVFSRGEVLVWLADLTLPDIGKVC